MSAYAPPLPRTAEPRGIDRALVQLGELLADAGRRRASRRTHRTAAGAGSERATATRRRDAHQASVVEHLRDNAAQVSPLGLR
jgi:hypothetical protein